MDQTPAPATTQPSDPWGRRAWQQIQAVRSLCPLIHCMTNFVSMDLVANSLLAAGASPAMVLSALEVPDFTPRVHALYINVGTIDEDRLPAMRAAAVAAAEARIPWVLDPVAVSVSEFRLRSVLELVELRPIVIRGNASEIIALESACRDGDSKGADSFHDSIDAVEAAKKMAQTSGSIVAVSGAIDYVTDGHKVLAARNGVAMMQKITATGCALTAIIAAFVAVEPSNSLEATACALSIFGLAGELGMELSKGPGTLRVHLIDSLHGLDEQTVVARVNISPV